jgi:osmotically inducible protein OsmC
LSQKIKTFFAGHKVFKANYDSNTFCKFLDYLSNCFNFIPYSNLNYSKMQIKRSAKAVWNGSGKEGTGNITSQSGVLNATQYSFNTRFADGIGTNPEELIAAAHAGCFSMKLAFNLQGAGITPDDIQTNAVVILENGGINLIELSTSVKAHGLSLEKLTELALDAKANCPISALFKAEITLAITLL